MALLTPTLEKAKSYKQAPTPGELHLLEFLSTHFGDEVEVYFQPCFNGDRPDIVVMGKTVGVIVIEVKDWNLQNYFIDDKNRWILKLNRKSVRSPFAQVYKYKQNFFEIHVNGLLEKSLRNEDFYGLIKTHVYFHGASKLEINSLYQGHLDRLYESASKNEQDLKSKAIDFDTYESRRIWIESKKYKFERDLGFALYGDKLKKIAFPLTKKDVLFEESVYLEFQRLLSPPFHYANDGKPIQYSDKQSALIKSVDGGRLKICGLAGSGKTVVLAGRAVDAHKRHKGRVLILTFNITLCRYIHDKVSAVREDFAWSEFDFNNYHRFITMALNNSEIDVVVPKELIYDGKDKQVARRIAEERDKYFETAYYSNESVFDGHDIKTKYGTILVDEIQDYKPEWIKILRANFLEEGGEMILFGDEKQNIYGRALDGERRSKLVEGFGRWMELSKSFRYMDGSPIISLVSKFQKEFLEHKYYVDSDKLPQFGLTARCIHAYGIYEYGMIENLASQIIQLAKSNKIHPNDISIISSQEHLLQRLDHKIRTSEHHRERTLSTFPALEVTDHPKYSKRYSQISASKKYGFNLNSGVMKLSSTHSFKGYESPFVFLIVNEGDSPEIVFTGLTRAKENIVVYMQKDCEFLDFFNRHLAGVQTVLAS